MIPFMTPSVRHTTTGYLPLMTTVDHWSLAERLCPVNVQMWLWSDKEKLKLQPQEQ